MKNARSTGTVRCLPPLPVHGHLAHPDDRHRRAAASGPPLARSPPSSINNTIARSRCVSRSARNTATSSAGKLSGNGRGLAHQTAIRAGTPPGDMAEQSAPNRPQPARAAR